MICAWVWWMRLGMEVGQLVDVVSPKPSMVRVATVASPVAVRAAVIPYEASCITESPRIMTRADRPPSGRW